MLVPDSIEIKQSNGKGLFTKKVIKKEAVVFPFEGFVGNDSQTNKESLQIDKDKFLESTVEFDNFLNHSCDPNCYIDWHSYNLVALRDIKKGEELSFNYNTAEYDLINLVKNCSFKCNCGSINCIGEVRGFKFLSKYQKYKIEKYVSPFLKTLPAELMEQQMQ